MILIPILTLIWLAVRIHTDYRNTDPDSYDLWLQEANDKQLEVIK